MHTLHKKNALKTVLNDRVEEHRSSQNGYAPRSGISLILVMFALSLSLVLTYSFIQSQSIFVQISENGSRRELARNAARAGISDALNRINSLNWAGLSDEYERTFHTDSDGTSTYTISFAASHNSLGSILELDVLSLGAWTSAENIDMRTEYQITAKVRLVPRLAGRTILTGDSAVATDSVANTGQYDLIKQYALFAEEGTYSLVLDPCDRIDGNIWLNDRLQIFKDPYWDSSVRRLFMQDLGTRFVNFPVGSISLAEATVQYPHPIAGHITFYNSPNSTIQQDLSDLKVSWSTTTERLSIPSPNYSQFATYRLYAGGPEYHAVSLNSSLYNVTLKPSPDNPLGIFYRSGNLTVYDNVVIQGTLVASSRIRFQGKGIYVTAFNWKDSAGEPLIPNADLWPRLPTLVAEDIYFDRSTQTSIEGAVVCHDKIDGGGGAVSYPNATEIQLTGTATAVSIEQPNSIVTLRENRVLNTLSSDGTYAIWLNTTGSGKVGSTGTWYPIVGVDSQNQQLTIRGEIDHATPVSYQIKLHKQALTQIRGPVCAEKIDFRRLNEWVLSTSLWDNRIINWETDLQGQIIAGTPQQGFSEWLEDPLNFADWDTYYQTFGLNLEPTLHIQHLTDREYRWEPPLFEPYNGGELDPEYSGYRWSLIDWKESP